MYSLNFVSFLMTLLGSIGCASAILAMDYNATDIEKSPYWISLFGGVLFYGTLFIHSTEWNLCVYFAGYSISAFVQVFFPVD
jgi:hypothetical protein